jgi:release factor glutamine methyltransferase
MLFRVCTPIKSGSAYLRKLWVQAFTESVGQYRALFLWCLDDKGFTYLIYKKQHVLLKDIQTRFHQELDTIYDKNEVESFFFMISESFYDINRLQFAIMPDLVVENTEAVQKTLASLKNEVPIQYILGETEFFGLPFKVNNHVLIPRPETEELVEWVIKKAKTIQSANNDLTILDIGTGSGCIAISLAKNLPEANIYALDISKEALNVAKQNALLNEVTVAFIEANILDFENWDLTFKNLKFDIIVSNPPYVREYEKSRMKVNVLDYEPHLALFVPDENPLQFYKAITMFSASHLNNDGRLFFEINEYLGNDMIQLLKKYNFANIELKQDIFRKDRMIKGQIV